MHPHLLAAASTLDLGAVNTPVVWVLVAFITGLLIGRRR